MAECCCWGTRGRTCRGEPITIAEDLQSDKWRTKDVGAGGAGFGSQWDAMFVHTIRQAVITPQDQQRARVAIRDAICYRYNDDTFDRVIYSESHDEVANGKARCIHSARYPCNSFSSYLSRKAPAICEQEFLDRSYGYRQNRSAQEAVLELTFELQYGRYGYVVEADIREFFDNMDHDQLCQMLEQRIDDQAFLGLIRQWLKAGILETDGCIIHPQTGTPQGGIVSPVLANVYLHHVLDRWFHEVVQSHCQGEAIMVRYADDWVCAFQLQNDAERFYRVLPKRLGKFHLEVAPNKTQILRFCRYNLSMTRRFVFLGFEFYWNKDRQGVPRVMRRTARKKLQGACRRIKAWIKTNRHEDGVTFFKGLNLRLRGHYQYYGLRGNYDSLQRFFWWATQCTFKWLNRRGGKKRSFNWATFALMLDRVKRAKPRITERRRPPVMA